MNYVLTQIIWASATAFLFVLVSLAFRRKTAARPMYLLGWILALSFILPVKLPLLRVEIPESKAQEMGCTGDVSQETVVFPYVPDMGTENTETENAAPGTSAPAQPAQTEKDSEFPTEAVVFAIYVLGVFATLFCTFFRYCRAVKALQRCGRAPTERERRVFTELCEKQGVSRVPRLLVCPQNVIGSSVMFGFKRQSILIADNLKEEDLALILGHELTHCKRKDQLFKAVLALLGALYWFNPMIHLFIRTMNDLCEESCDEKFLSGGDWEEKQRYCRLLILTATVRKTENKALFTTFKGGKIQMKRRLNNILTEKSKKVTALVICATLALAAVSSAVYAVVVPELPEENNAVVGTIGTLAPLTDSELQAIEDEIRVGREEISSNYTDEENEFIVEQSTKYSIENKTNGYVTDGKYKGIPSMLTKDGIPVIAVITSDNGGVSCEVNPYTNAEGIILKFTRHADRSMTVEELSMEKYLEYYVSVNCSKLTYEEMANWCESNGTDLEEWTKNTLFLEEYINEDGTYDFVKFYNDIVEAKGWANKNFIDAWYGEHNTYGFQDPAAALRTYLSRIGVTVE